MIVRIEILRAFLMIAEARELLEKFDDEMIYESIGYLDKSACCLSGLCYDGGLRKRFDKLHKEE